MFLTVANFLEEFKAFEVSQIGIEGADITHTVAIGDNYEGLTPEPLDKAQSE